jgi:hypothetical protein
LKGGFIDGDVEMHYLRLHQGGALQTAEMPPMPGKGQIRKIGIVRKGLTVNQAFVAESRPAFCTLSA